MRPASLAADLSRRDFTVNAMAVPLAGDPDLIDPHRGLEDLRRGVLQVLHPGSFEDDPTRALRAARYAARYALALEPTTAELIRRAELATVSRDRAEAELGKLAAEPEARRAFELLGDWGLLELRPEALELAAAVGELDGCGAMARCRPAGGRGACGRAGPGAPRGARARLGRAGAPL